MAKRSTGYHAGSDKELRSRVKLLGKLLGNVLLKHEEPEVFHAVEALRTGFIQLRKRNNEPRRRSLIRLIENLQPGTINQVIRALRFILTWSILPRKISSIVNAEFQYKRKAMPPGPVHFTTPWRNFSNRISAAKNYSTCSTTCPIPQYLQPIQPNPGVAPSCIYSGLYLPSSIS